MLLRHSIDDFAFETELRLLVIILIVVTFPSNLVSLRSIMILLSWCTIVDLWNECHDTNTFVATL